MAVLADDIADLALIAQRNLGRFKFTDISYDLQEHVAFNMLMKKQNVEWDSNGIGHQFNIIHKAGPNARVTGLFSVDDVNRDDGIVQGYVPWRYIETAYAVEKRELSINNGPAQILDSLKVERHRAMVAYAELWEEEFWSVPSSTSDTTSLYGVQYWLVKNATAGFNGRNHASFSAGPASVSATTYPNWSNYTDKYVDVTRTDLIRRMRKAYAKCRFMAPVPGQSYNTGNKWGIYANYDVTGVLEERAEDQNDNLGNDIASKDDKVTFRGVPVTYVPYFDSDTSDPIWGINWGTFKIICRRGWWMKESPLAQAPNQHNTLQAFVDTTANVKCTDRRRNFAIYK